MKIIPEDIAIASQVFKILKYNQPGAGAIADTIMNAGSNKSIRALVTLQFLDNTTAFIKVKGSDSILLSNGLVVPPFTYAFRFKKTD